MATPGRDSKQRRSDRPAVTLVPCFVQSIPKEADEIKDGYLYICLRYNMIVHRCPCGCNGLSEIGLNRRTRTFIYDGVGVTLEPSVGARALPCRSHYWIRDNQVLWSAPLTMEDDIWYERKRRRLLDQDKRSTAQKVDGQAVERDESTLAKPTMGRKIILAIRRFLRKRVQ